MSERTQVSEVGCLHVARLLFEDGRAAARERVHVSRDGADGHVARAGRLQDGMVISRRGVEQHGRALEGGGGIITQILIKSMILIKARLHM